MVLDLLIQPKQVSSRPGRFAWPKLPVFASATTADRLPLGQLADDLKRRLGRKAVIVGNAFGPCCLRIRRDPRIGDPQRYRLVISPTLIEIAAGADAGAYYAIQTLREMFAVHVRSLPCCQIEDWPDFPRRGVYHDISRGKIPTVATLKALVERLARWKINELLLFVAGVFEFQRHPAIGAGFSRLTARDVLELQDHCKLHHVRLIGSMATFSHMGGILSLPQYRHLGEMYHPDEKKRQPSGTLYPGDPKSLRFVEELYEEFVPLFEAGDFHVCGDEAYDLGQGRSKARARRIGVGHVYLEFMLKLRKLCRGHGKAMNAWGDMVLHHTEIFPDIPKDVVLYNWDFFKGGNYLRRTHEFAEAGVPFMVCPSACAFQSHGGRILRSMRSITSFAEEGRRHGAIGMLCTDWGDYGHRNPLGVSLHGFAFSGAVAWNGSAYPDVSPRTRKGARPVPWRPTAVETAFTERFCYHTFGVRDPRMARLMQFLGDTYHIVEGGDDNVLFMAWRYPLLPKEGLDVPIYQTRPDGCRQVIARLGDPSVWPSPAKGMDRFEALALEEFALAARMDVLAAHKAELGRGLLMGEPVAPASLRAYADDMDDLAGQFKRLWLARNKPSHLGEILDMFALAAREARAAAR